MGLVGGKMAENSNEDMLLWMRETTATLAAHGMVIDVLLGWTLLELPPAAREAFTSRLLARVRDIDQFRGIAGDQYAAESFADTILKAQSIVEGIVKRAAGSTVQNGQQSGQSLCSAT